MATSGEFGRCGGDGQLCTISLAVAKFSPRAVDTVRHEKIIEVSYVYFFFDASHAVTLRARPDRMHARIAFSFNVARQADIMINHRGQLLKGVINSYLDDT